MKKSWFYWFAIIIFITVLLLLFWRILFNAPFDEKHRARAQVRQTVTILPSSEQEPEPVKKPFVGDGFFFTMPITKVEDGVGGWPIPEEEFFPKEEIVPEEELIPEKKMLPEELPLIKKIAEEKPFPEEIVEVLEISEIVEAPFEVKLTIENRSKKIFPGDELIARGKIVKLKPEKRVNVSLRYQIKDSGNNILFDYNEMIYIEDVFSFIRNFYVAEEAWPDKYFLFLELQYGDVFASSSDTFEVLAGPVPAFFEKTIVSIKDIFRKNINFISDIFLIIFNGLIWILRKIQIIITNVLFLLF